MKEVTKEVAKSYGSYINNIIGESLTTNPKQFWSFIRKNRTENLGIPSLKVNDIVKTTDSDKANALNDYFKSVFTNEQLPTPTKQLKALNPNKASGPDAIPAKVLKETANEIAPIIQHIFQQSYTSGQLPEAWTTAVVTAIYKKRQQVRAASMNKCHQTDLILLGFSKAFDCVPHQRLFTNFTTMESQDLRSIG